MSYRDQQLTCAECGRAFTDTADDQAYRAGRGYANTPRRCPDCRAARRAGGGGYSEDRSGGGGSGGSRQLYDVVCSACGKETQVPFQPRGDRPVYCSDCFSRQGGGGGGGYGGGRSRSGSGRGGRY
jgi:CxxC-x17-CxxC domain-containing protein